MGRCSGGTPRLHALVPRERCDVKRYFLHGTAQWFSQMAYPGSVTSYLLERSWVASRQAKCERSSLLRVNTGIKLSQWTLITDIRVLFRRLRFIYVTNNVFIDVLVT